MEPPGEGRYEEHVEVAIFGADAAAMEPPGEGRYEVRPDNPMGGIRRPPQWSRPVKGGTRGPYSIVRFRPALPRRNGAAR